MPPRSWTPPVDTSSPVPRYQKKYRMTTITQIIATELKALPSQVDAAVGLLDEGATVPFIARYRKEATGGLDDIQLRHLEERLGYLRELWDRRDTVLRSIEEQGKLTEALRADIMGADTKQRLEDLYLPYKPKRRTKAQIAREAGLEPLADALLADPTLDPQTQGATYVDAAKGVADAAAALEGARQILMERFAEDPHLAGRLREHLWEQGILVSRVMEGKEQEGNKFSDYFDYSEAIHKIPSHRALALFRGRNQGVLNLDLLAGEGEDPDAVCRHLIAERFGVQDLGRAADAWLVETVRKTWRVKLAVRLDLDLKGRLGDAAEEEAIRVFARNLSALLLAAPAGRLPTLGLDPGLRTGVKVAVVDGTGRVVATDTIYPHVPKNQWDQSIARLAVLAANHGVKLISIGNGTASRETDRLARELIKRHPELGMKSLVVSEAGASVYSASEYASHELPDLDVSLRGAVSIARRLQDPLAELVKIEPKAIGVGQYQHDVNQGKLGRSLETVVEDCVNAVGVDLNTASVPLLAQVSGLNRTIAENIVRLREDQGAFANRAGLKQVPPVGGQDLPAVCRLPAGTGWERAPGRLRRSPRGLSRGAAHPGQGGQGHRRAHRRQRDPAAAECRRVHRRPIWAAHRAGHPRGVGEAGARSTPGVSRRGVHGGRRDPGRPQAGHDPRGHRDQRHQLRRLRGHRRPPGWPGTYLPALRPIRQRPLYGGQDRRPGEGQGARGGHPAQAHRPDTASGGKGGPGSAQSAGRTRRPGPAAAAAYR